MQSCRAGAVWFARNLPRYTHQSSVNVVGSQNGLFAQPEREGVQNSARPGNWPAFLTGSHARTHSFLVSWLFALKRPIHNLIRLVNSFMILTDSTDDKGIRHVL